MKHALIDLHLNMLYCHQKIFNPKTVRNTQIGNLCESPEAFLNEVCHTVMVRIMPNCFVCKC